MKAAVFHKPKDIRVETVPDPSIQQPRDAIIRVTSTAICGSDLHIYIGAIPQPGAFGCGPVGLMALKVARKLGAGQANGVDVLPYRLAAAQRTSGATTMNASEEDAVDRIRELTGGRGADVAC